MTSNTLDVARTSKGRLTIKGEQGPELEPLEALGPESPRPLQIAVLQEVVGLRVREIAYASSVSEQTVRNWKKADTHDRPDGYEDLRAVVERILLADSVEPRLAGAWFRSRNRGLGYSRPLEAIRAGDFARVMDVAESFVALAPPLAARSADESRRRRDDYASGRDIGDEVAEVLGERGG